MSTEVETTAPQKPWYKNAVLGPMVLGEAPIFRASDSTLHWVDPLKEPAELHILHVKPDTGAPEGEAKTFVLEDSVTFVYFRKGKKGSYICAYYQGIAFLDEETGKLEVVKEIIPTSERPNLRFNDGALRFDRSSIIIDKRVGAVDAKGRLWLAEIDKKVRLSLFLRGVATERTK